MNRNWIGILLLLATASVAGIIATQIYWLDKAFKVQRSQIDLRNEQAVAEAKQFNDRVTIALTNVANEILTINNDPAKLFEAVKQVRPNFFTVAINDTVHPYLLETLLRREFQQRHIAENFEYGVYDCFTDSIVYGNYVPLSADTLGGRLKGQTPQLKWEKDGHYFSVFFPDREAVMPEVLQPAVSTWAFSAVITFIVFVFFAYAVHIILKQKRLSEMKTDFINNMTHELKTPISTISLSSEALMGSGIAGNPDRIRQYAQLIYNENQRLRMQVERVLQLATLDREKAQLKKEPVDLHTLLVRATSALELTHGKDELQLSCALRARESTITGDPVHLANILHNLLDNAVKYSGDRAEITVTTGQDNGEIRVSIADKGIGIPAHALPHIFHKFYRVHTGNLHDVKGFGLGLYYVKEMVKAHKGGIDVESRPGEGTTFTMWFKTRRATNGLE
jgi:two-component system phosphate regulon sensor histidine kinase PhoR